MNFKKTILHIDDDPLMLRVIAQRLKSEGHNVTSAHDPIEALKELAVSHHRVVLLDIDLPSIDGLEMLRRIKSDYGGTQVIMLTGIVTLQTALQSFRWGAEACIFKPVTDITPLVTAIDAAFDKIDRWWSTIQYLSHQKLANKTTTSV